MRRCSCFFLSSRIAAVCHEMVDIEGIVLAKNLLWGLLQLADDLLEICSKSNDGEYHGLQTLVSMPCHLSHRIRHNAPTLHPTSCAAGRTGTPDYLILLSPRQASSGIRSVSKSVRLLQHTKFETQANDLSSIDVAVRTTGMLEVMLLLVTLHAP